MRADFFGADGDTTENLKRLRRDVGRFTHHAIDIRNRPAIDELVASHRPDAIIHCAAQPSHDLAKDRPFDDFEINAVGTLNLLEAARRHCPEAPFIFMSTNKVWRRAQRISAGRTGDALRVCARPQDYDGIDEACRVDNCLHSLFGASKLAADVAMVQDAGATSACRPCASAAAVSPVRTIRSAELHGFLAYVARRRRKDGSIGSTATARSRSATIFTRTMSAARSSPSTTTPGRPLCTLSAGPGEQCVGDGSDRPVRGLLDAQTEDRVTSIARASAITSATSATCTRSSAITRHGRFRARSTTSFRSWPPPRGLSEAARRLRSGLPVLAGGCRSI